MKLERNLCNCVRSLAKSKNCKLLSLKCRTEKLSSINLFQTKGFEGLAISSRFSRSSIKITEKTTVVLVPIATPCVCMKCRSLNLMLRILFKYEPQKFL